MSCYVYSSHHLAYVSNIKKAEISRMPSSVSTNLPCTSVCAATSIGTGYLARQMSVVTSHLKTVTCQQLECTVSYSYDVNWFTYLLYV